MQLILVIQLRLNIAMINKLWDWIDDRQIDKHIVAIIVLYGTKLITTWAMQFAVDHHNSDNAIGIAAIIGAVSAPYMALQAAVIKFYFESRNGNGTGS